MSLILITHTIIFISLFVHYHSHGFQIDRWLSRQYWHCMLRIEFLAKITLLFVSPLIPPFWYFNNIILFSTDRERSCHQFCNTPRPTPLMSSICNNIKNRPVLYQENQWQHSSLCPLLCCGEYTKRSPHFAHTFHALCAK